MSSGNMEWLPSAMSLMGFTCQRSLTAPPIKISPYPRMICFCYLKKRLSNPFTSLLVFSSTLLTFLFIRSELTSNVLLAMSSVIPKSLNSHRMLLDAV